MTLGRSEVNTLGRLERTRTFRNGVSNKWLKAELHIFGAGTLGYRLATEAVVAGANVIIYDFDTFSAENAGTQSGPIGMRKIDYVAARAEMIAPGRVRGICADVRHVGIGTMISASVLIDCTDDPSLALPLARISNGLAAPLLRAALDGSGEHERGRVACSHGGAGHACQICTYEPRDVTRYLTRTPCPGNPSTPVQPTLAGGAIAMAVSGVTLLQAQRLVTGNDLDLVHDREWVIDLDVGALWPLRRRRCEQCLSGHLRWELIPIDCQAAETTFDDLFRKAGDHLGNGDLTIEPYGHPLCREATCHCGGHGHAVGTPWAPAPRCPDCGQGMEWSRATSLSRLALADAQQMRISDVPLDVLGLPPVGAMIVARAPGKRPVRLLLR